MFRRSILEFSSRRSIRRIPRRDTSQSIPSLLSLRKEFSTSPQQNASPKAGSGSKPPESRSNLPKVAAGSAIVGGAGLLAYQSGYLDQYIGKQQQNSARNGIDYKDVKDTQISGEQLASTISEESVKLGHDVEQTAQKVQTEIDLPQFEVQQKVESKVYLPRVETEQKAETHGDLPLVQAEERVEPETDIRPHEAVRDIEEKSDVVNDGSVAVQEKQRQEFSQSTKAKYSLGMENSESKITGETSEGVQVPEVTTQVTVVTDEDAIKVVPPQQLDTEDGSKAALGNITEAASLLESYHLKDRAEESTATEGPGEEALGPVEELDDGFVMKDGKLVMSFLQAIHAAEQRQAELDAHAFAEEKRALKEKYEKELKDLRARELMHAEEAAMLDKEIKRERAKAAAAIRNLQEKMEEKLRMELEQKESEAEANMKRIQELAKAELTSSIASEKAVQIEKMAEANLNINALCMAFYARSEEARQIHSVHKLALGALALEDALSKGLPIQQELDALNTYMEGTDKDSLIHLVLSTLPEETRYHGTDTLLQLNQKFNALKGTLRHYILIPPGGGGILSHAMAQVASWLRFKEVDPSGDGIESVIARVESFLAEGKLAEAANALQEGLRGSEAEEIAGDWMRRARNRAITEQALSVLQSYAACISLTQ
ncbi:MICOS complex subunit mic60 [Ricinus communis]|uniref:MICOS complex subunit mic60 n=1 Tax=Ricinus communis TaxID=3988 RepID=UPI00201AC928|nr:MICOS complex subunit mic60 [Ricinus communis]